MAHFHGFTSKRPLTTSEVGVYLPRFGAKEHFLYNDKPPKSASFYDFLKIGLQMASNGPQMASDTNKMFLKSF